MLKHSLKIIACGLTLSFLSHADPDTELINAITKQDQRAVQALLKQGAHANATATQTISPLIAALATNNPEIINALVSTNADLTVRNAKGQTPLMIAALNNNAQIATMIKNGLNSYLLDALIKKDTTNIDKWLHEGADPNTQDASGTPSIILALDNNDAIRLLATHRENENAKDNQGHLATDLVPSPASEVMPIVRNSTLDINKRNKDGATALIMAANKGFSDSARTLLEYNADPMIKDPAGNSPLSIAIGKHDITMAKTLLSPRDSSKISLQEKLSALSNAESNNLNNIVDALHQAGITMPEPQQATLKNQKTPVNVVNTPQGPIVTVE